MYGSWDYSILKSWGSIGYTVLCGNPITCLNFLDLWIVDHSLGREAPRTQYRVTHSHYTDSGNPFLTIDKTTQRRNPWLLLFFIHITSIFSLVNQISIATYSLDLVEQESNNSIGRSDKTSHSRNNTTSETYNHLDLQRRHTESPTTNRNREFHQPTDLHWTTQQPKAAAAESCTETIVGTKYTQKDGTEAHVGADHTQEALAETKNKICTEKKKKMAPREQWRRN